MKQAQKVIKYLAIAFGLYLAINIIGWIVFGVTMLLGIDMGRNLFTGATTELVEYSEVFSNVESLKLEIAYADVEIKTGNELKVVGKIDPNRYEIKVENKTLKIQEIGQKWWNLNFNKESTITLYIPENLTFSEAKIDIGAGTTKIEKLNATHLNLDLGAGEVEIQNCKAQKSDIDCGAGNVAIHNSALENLKLDAGVGEIFYNGYILGNSEIECGVGRLILDLQGGEELYSIEAEHGIGEINLNEEKLKENVIQGNGKNKIKIEGGIGEIQINM